jgi:hypothetical protein
MSDVSGLYSSNRTHYKRTGRKSSKGLNGDLKHIRYKDGEPIQTEIIKVATRDEDTGKHSSSSGSKPKRIKAARKERRSNEEVTKQKKGKLSDRLKKAIQLSQTLWSEKDGIYISYQGSRGFLVKLYNESQTVIRNEIMTQAQIMESTIPGILDAGWKVV